MKLKCPACGAEATLEQMTQAADLLALAKAQAAFGDDWPLVAEYLDGFRRADVSSATDARPTRPLMVKKLLRLAREVWAMWQPWRFTYGRQEFSVGRAEFREALAGVANRDLRGLTSHNYLKKALMAAAEKTSQRRERELREKEEQLRRRTTGETPVPLDARPTAAPEWLAQAKYLGQAVRRAKTPEARAEAQTRYREYLEKAP